MDPNSGQPSPRRQLQGPRPPPLKVRKESHKIKKPPIHPTSAAIAQEAAAAAQHNHSNQTRARAAQPHQRQYHNQALQSQQHNHQQEAPPRQPVIIYDASPKIIHTKPGDFMALVQRLTGPSGSVMAPPPPPQPTQAATTSAAQQENYDIDPQSISFLAEQLLFSPTMALSPAGAISPAARFAAIERSVRPTEPGPAQRAAAHAQLIEIMDDDAAAIDIPAAPQLDRPGHFHGILSPLPSSLPTISPGFFSPLPYDPSAGWLLNELSPLLAAATGGGAAGVAAAGNNNIGSGFGFSGGSGFNNSTSSYRSSFDPFSPRNFLATPTLPSPASFMDLFNNLQDL